MNAKMMKNPHSNMRDVNIIIPVYNVDLCIKRCLDSIGNQAYKDYEVILVDDGSTDKCSKICDEYAKLDSRIIVIHQNNGGLSAARNSGIELFLIKDNSKYITFVDSDDYLTFDALQILLSGMERDGTDVVIAGFKETYTLSGSAIIYYDIHNASLCLSQAMQFDIISGRQACKYIYTRPPKRYRNIQFVTAWGKLYKKELFSSIRYPVGRIHEDDATTYKLFYKAKNISLTNYIIYNYFINKDGITRNRFNIKRYDTVIALDEAEKYFYEMGDNELIELVADKRKTVLFRFELKARKAGIYKLLPDKYRNNYLWNLKQVEHEIGRDRYENIMSEEHPFFIKLQAYMRKILEIL